MSVVLKNSTTHNNLYISTKKKNKSPQASPGDSLFLVLVVGTVNTIAYAIGPKIGLEIGLVVFGGMLDITAQTSTAFYSKADDENTF